LRSSPPRYCLKSGADTIDAPQRAARSGMRETNFRRLYRDQISTMLSLQPGEWPEREEESKMQKIKTTNK